MGSGFGGAYAALQLEKRLARDRDVEITLVNRDNFFLFTPMLHEVAASDQELTNIVSPVRKLLRRVSFFAGDVESIDLANKQVRLVHGSDRHGHDVRYDYLLISLGSVTNFYNLPGVQERALTMKTLGDAIALRNRAIARLEEADTECARDIREPLMTFVVVGGGFAGVETIGSLNDFVRESLRFYPRVQDEQVRMVLVHAGPTILPELGEQLGGYAQRKLTQSKIEVHTNVQVASVTNEGVHLNDGGFVRCATVVWTAGTSPHPMIGRLPCMTEKGRLKVNQYLEVADQSNVWAIGDCAAVPDPRTGKLHPPTAQHALRQGKVAAHNIQVAIRGSGSKKPFDFTTLGQLAAIGRRTGVARILGFNFSGFPAWFLWRTIYLSKLPRFEKKLRVALDWTLDLFFSKDLVQYLTLSGMTAGAVDAPTAARVHQQVPPAVPPDQRAPHGIHADQERPWVKPKPAAPSSATDRATF